MNKYDNLDEVISDLENINYELKLQPIETKPESRIKELQDGLNVIKEYLDQYEKLSVRKNKFLSARRLKISKVN